MAVQTSFTVKLTKIDPKSKVKAIKAVKDLVPGLNLVEVRCIPLLLFVSEDYSAFVYVRNNVNYLRCSVFIDYNPFRRRSLWRSCPKS